MDMDLHPRSLEIFGAQVKYMTIWRTHMITQLE